MRHRHATPDDAPLLGRLNGRLIQDEGHRNPMSVAELAERMRHWLASDYRAVLFELDGTVAAYALYRDEPELVYLRQFFVERDCRRAGLARQCLQRLLDEVWPRGKRVTVEVLAANAAGVAFWRAVGFADYCLTLEMLPAARSSVAGDGD